MCNSENDIWLIELYLKQPSLFYRIISQKDDLNVVYIELFKDKLDWTIISRKCKHCNKLDFWQKFEEYIKWWYIRDNNNIIWTEELCLEYDYYTKDFDFDGIDIVEKAIWDEKLLYKYDVRWSRFSYRKDVNWTIELIERFKCDLDWKALSSNSSLPWSESFLERYKDKWLWGTDGIEGSNYFYNSILHNPAIKWDSYLIEKYYEMIVWSELSKSVNVLWSEAIIEKYSSNWDWEALSKNNSIIWNQDLILRFIDKWDLHLLFINSSYIQFDWALDFKVHLISDIIKNKYTVNYNGLSKVTEISWTDELVYQFNGRINWVYLSQNKSLNLSEIFLINNLESFIDKYRYDYSVFGTNYSSIVRNISKNNLISWNSNLLASKKEFWDWNSLSSNKSLPWSIELIRSFEEYWNWEVLSGNGHLPWSIEFIKLFEKYWTWSLPEDYFLLLEVECAIISLSLNENLPWSNYLISEFYYKWNWNELSQNKSIPWCDELIDLYINKWNWKYLCSNSSIEFNDIQIIKYKDFLDWEHIKIDWNPQLIEVFLNTKWNIIPVSLNNYLFKATNSDILSKVADVLVLDNDKEDDIFLI